MESIQTTPGIDAPSKASPESSQYDIVCIGFGPAALSIAIAMHERGPSSSYKNVLFLERQAEFGWHTGMLLPGTKMQISFMKDLATMRNPQSYFTFVNYLHKHNRLANFINLSTQTPFREEFNDYMKWCASHFGDQVKYNQEVLRVSPGQKTGSIVDSFWVTSRDVRSGDVQRICAKHVIVANGGEYSIPEGLKSPDVSDRIVHSSQYLNRVPQQFTDENAEYRFAVVGGGQSAVEISEDLQSRYPKSRVSLIFRDSALRPSDDSPFVNEIFDPASVDEFYSLDSAHRKQSLKKNKATNYSVVRLPLIEHIYEKIYRQRLLKPDPKDWTLSLYHNSEVFGAQTSQSGNALNLQLKNTVTWETKVTEEAYDLVVLATGYQRKPFAGILKDLKPLLLSASEENGSFVQRNYRLLFRPGSVVRDAAIWMQGSCETTHGISDTLLSILAVRADELLDSINASRKTVENKARL